MCQSSQSVEAFAIDDFLPEGALAYREYQIVMPDGTRATVAVTLGDRIVPSISREFARRSGATFYGLIAVLDLPGAPEIPMVWTQRKTQTAIAAAAEGYAEMGKDLKLVVVRVLGMFFADIASIEPTLVGHWSADKTAKP
jgi:hypothetical protein